MLLVAADFYRSLDSDENDTGQLLTDFLYKAFKAPFMGID